MVTKLTEETARWSIDNEEILIANYFDINFDLYDKYNPHSECLTKESYITLEENFDVMELPAEFISDVFNSLGERCGQCFALLQPEEYTTVEESRGECHGALCTETIPVSYKCNSCGFEEDI